MKIAILGDSHDHYVNLRKAVDYANEYKCELMLFTGDLGAPGNCTEILTQFTGQIKMVLGNNDAEIIGLMRRVAKYDNFELIKTYKGGNSYQDIVDGVRIFMHHYPLMAELAAKSGDYDLAIFGHTHKYYEEKINECLLLNPSSIHPNKTQASIVIFDTLTREHIRIMLLED